MPLSPSAQPPKIIIAGGTGFLGQLLSQSFLKDGYDVVLLSRNRLSNSEYGRTVLWDAKTIDEWSAEVEGARALINLTGRSIDCRHTSSNRRKILDSRILSTRILGDAIMSCEVPPPVWFNASSMALYGQCFGSEPAHDENAPIQQDSFLEEVTVAWENEFFKFKRESVRQVALRISFILGHKSGAFPLLRTFAKWGLGGKQGNGDQWMSWLHQDDWVGIIRFLLKLDDFNGTINLSSPNPIQNKEFMRTLRSFLAPLGIGLPAPVLAVRLGCVLLGTAPELALQSRKVISSKLRELNYEFKYPQLCDAFRNLCD